MAFVFDTFIFRGTMLNWIDPNEWFYLSKSMVRRQHKPEMVVSLILFLTEHFDVSFILLFLYTF